MNLFRPAICLSTIAALVVAASDFGKTSSPPADSLGQLLASASSSAPSSTTVVANTTGVRAIYDTWAGRPRRSAEPLFHEGTAEMTMQSNLTPEEIELLRELKEHDRPVLDGKPPPVWC
jgi:hypothetical protein